MADNVPFCPIPPKDNCPQSDDCGWWCGDDNEGMCAAKHIAMILDIATGVLAEDDEDDDENTDEDQGMRIVPETTDGEEQTEKT